ncbi:MAG: protease modulator HflC [Deltaproteobacteria bacterium]|nr:protease modulator HflC [Deltaproteobacteria bacterium]
MKATPALIVIILLFIVGSMSFYTVDEKEQVVITKFGRPIGEPIQTPGLKFKIPYHTANVFPKNLLEWDGNPDQIQTLEKTFIWVDAFGRWKIVDPLKYFQTLKNEIAARARLNDILNSEIRNAVTTNTLIETVRNTDRQLEIDTYDAELDGARKNLAITTVTRGRAKIVKGILDKSQPKLEEFGIQLVDIKIKRINYEEGVQNSVFGRMIAERKQIAEKFRSEGQGEARKIEGDREKEMKRITSEAYRTAEEIKGKADAEATLIYAGAYGKDPEFYSFLQTLDIYKQSIGKDSSLILSTDSEFLKYFKDYKGE